MSGTYSVTPRAIQIETNLACNAECPSCPYVHLDRSPKAMEDWVWRKIVDETRGLGIVYRPFLINEPLSEKRLPEIIRYIKRNATATVEINTTGGLLNEKRSREILDAGIDVVRLSVDGFSKQTYEPARPGVDYDTVVVSTWAIFPTRPVSAISGSEEVAGQPYTLVFLESPYRIVEALEDILSLLSDRRICVAREMTKLFEEYRRRNMRAALEHFKSRPARGEITLVVEGRKNDETAVWTEEEMRQAIEKD